MMGLMDFLMSKRNAVDSKIASKKKEIAEIISKAVTDDRFSFFEFCYAQEVLDKCEEKNNSDTYNYFYNMFLNWDKYCKMTRDQGTFINEQLSDDLYVLAVHRTDVGNIEDRDGVPYNSSLNDIMENGFINNGQVMQGAVSSTRALTLAMTPIKSLGGLINMVVPYKGSNATILFQFPINEIDQDLSFKEEDFYLDGSVVDPKYIIGAIVDGKFYNKEDLIKGKGDAYGL